MSINQYMYKQPSILTREECLEIAPVLKKYLATDYIFDPLSKSKKVLRMADGRDIQHVQVHNGIMDDIAFVEYNEIGMKTGFKPAGWKLNEFNVIETVRGLSQTSLEKVVMFSINGF